MNRRLLYGMFAREHDLLAVAKEARACGYPIVDAFTPYPVHGLDEAMGLAPSRLSRICLLCGLVGVGIAFAFQQWTMAVDWPLNVGGRPFNSWPAFVPVAFEVMVLCAGFGVVFAFFGVSRLHPGKRTGREEMAASDDQFVLVVEAKGAATDADAVFQLFCNYQATETKEVDKDAARPSHQISLRFVNSALLFAFVIVGLLIWTLGNDPGRPNWEFLPDMAHAVPYDSFAPHPDLPRHMAMQPPPEGTIARGHLPLHYEPTPKDAERAGDELENPFRADDLPRRQRGAQVYAQQCVVCHGAGGKGDGPVSLRGVPPPASLIAEKAVKMKDGQLFHVITYGQVNMASYAAQVERDDRWAVILHIRQLQQADKATKEKAETK